MFPQNMACPRGSRGVTHHALQSKQNLLCERGRESQVALLAQLPIPPSLEPLSFSPQGSIKSLAETFASRHRLCQSLTACFYIYFVTLKQEYCFRGEIRWKVFVSFALWFFLYFSLSSPSQYTVLRWPYILRRVAYLRSGLYRESECRYNEQLWYPEKWKSSSK